MQFEQRRNEREMSHDRFVAQKEIKEIQKEDKSSESELKRKRK